MASSIGNTLLPDQIIRQASEIMQAAAQALPELRAWLAAPESPQALIALQQQTAELLKVKVQNVQQRHLLQVAMQVMACAYRMQWGQATDREQVMALSAWKQIDADMTKRMIESYFNAINKGEDDAIRRIFGG